MRGLEHSLNILRVCLFLYAFTCSMLQVNKLGQTYAYFLLLDVSLLKPGGSVFGGKKLIDHVMHSASIKIFEVVNRHIIHSICIVISTWN